MQSVSPPPLAPLRRFTRAEFDTAGLGEATAAAVDCAVPSLAQHLAFARTVAGWPLQR